MNLKKFLMAGGLSMVLILGACGSGEEEASEEPATEEDSSASSGDVDAESIARDNCASCHGQDFSGANRKKWPRTDACFQRRSN